MTCTLYSRILPGPEDSVPVVFLGALGTNASMWPLEGDTPSESAYARLAAEHTLVAVDLRGHGRSEVPAGPWTIEDMARDVIALCDEHQWETVHVVGLSIGGAVTQILAATFPERIATVTLIATATSFGTPKKWSDLAELISRDGTRAVTQSTVERWFTAEYLAAHPTVRSRIADMVAACPDEGYIGCCGALAQFDSVALLPRITAPTAIISGEFDAGSTPEAMRVLHDGIAGSSWLSLPGSHQLPIEFADTVARAITDHVTATS